MDYRRLYDQIMALGSQRGNKRRKGFELHHVIPTCMGGSNDKSNKVLLTCREHYVSHKLLTKIYPQHSGLRYAVWQMTNRADYRISGRSYKLARQSFLDVHPSRSAEFKAAISKQKKQEAAEGRLGFQSAKARAATGVRNKKLAAEGKLGLQSAKARAASSTRMKELRKVQAECPLCGKAGSRGNMLRYHFDNCLQHPGNSGLTRLQIKTSKLTVNK